MLEVFNVLAVQRRNLTYVCELLYVELCHSYARPANNLSIKNCPISRVLTRFLFTLIIPPTQRRVDSDVSGVTVSHVSRTPFRLC